jgi:hypothetical protein
VEDLKKAKKCEKVLPIVTLGIKNRLTAFIRKI